MIQFPISHKMGARLIREIKFLRKNLLNKLRTIQCLLRKKEALMKSKVIPTKSKNKLSTICLTRVLIKKGIHSVKEEKISIM